MAREQKQDATGPAGRKQELRRALRAARRSRYGGEDGAERARGAVAASDAFFPFADGAEILIEAGVSAIVQPGGSIRDEEVVEACRAAGVTMYFTGTRHFAH